jgi:DNA-binding transcriptional regulator GbsR (MarR family)
MQEYYGTVNHRNTGSRNRMGQTNGLLKGPVIRLFEKVAKWIGLSPNAGPVLAAFFLEQHNAEEKISSDDICRITGYSRANAGLIISQLEALGIIDGQRDYDQTGRGRKRVLYTINGGFADIFELGIIGIQERLNGIIRDLDAIESLDSAFKNSFGQLLKEIRKTVEKQKKEMLTTTLKQ